MADSRIETLLENWAGADNPILPPISNIERILQNILGVEGVEIEPIQSRNEALLLQILEQGGGSGSGSVSGLEYETGTVVLEEDAYYKWIDFAKTHDTLPFYVCFQDASGDYINQNSSYLYETISMFSNYSGEPTYFDSVNKYYGSVYVRSRNSGGNMQSSGADIAYPASDSYDASQFYTRYWVTESKFKIGFDNTTSIYWRAGRTYKWIAVWPPAAE